jgi:hypothetical protein
MFDKTFREMAAIDVSPFVKIRDDDKKKEAAYLPWAVCKKLLHDHGAENVMFFPVPGPDGSTLRKSELAFADKNGVENRCYEVLVHIVVDNLEWYTVYPVLNGNNPVKDNSMSQLRVHNAVRRAFVKGVAERIGLGFSLWLDSDDLPETTHEDDLSKHDLMKCKQRLSELITYKMNIQGIPIDVIAEKIGYSVDELRGMLGWYKILDRIERTVWEIQP